MLTKLLTYKTSIVATLIVAISSVYVCQVLCDLDIYSMKRACHATVCSSEDQPNSDHTSDPLLAKNHHSSINSHDHHGGDHSQSSHHPEQEDDCCEDMTTKVFDSLFPQKNSLPSLEAKLFFVFEIEAPLYKVSINNILPDPFKFYSDSSPPINVGDIYILVQSFLL